MVWKILYLSKILRTLERYNHAIASLNRIPYSAVQHESLRSNVPGYALNLLTLEATPLATQFFKMSSKILKQFFTKIRPNF